MSTLSAKRVGWLVRRLSKIYPAEIPYRIVGIVRAAAQRYGFFDASCPPPQTRNSTFGRSWIRVPQGEFVHSQMLIVVVDRIMVKGLPVFDVTVPFHDGVPEWNRDPKTGTVIEKTFGLYIDFRHIGGEVDIKYLWEMNRHAWWVSLAQAYTVSGDAKYLTALSRLIDSWLRENPYPLGANWSSPVEHGIRLINWSIVWHLVGGAGSPMFASSTGEALRIRWIDSVYQHLRFASDNYSFYSSADNHLIGEAAGVFVAAHTWDFWPEARILRARAKQLLEEEIIKQFSDDGVNLEQATCYHKFSLEFLLAAWLCGAANQDDFSISFKERMKCAIEFLASMMDCAGGVPNIGDSDDGKVFSFIGDGANSAYESLLSVGSALFGSRSLTAKLTGLGIRNFNERLWLVVPETREVNGNNATVDLPVRFEKGGYVLLGKDLHSADEIRITMDVGPLGYNRIAGHGHADALSVLLSCQGKDFLVDPGTYCYNAAPEFRRYFRGTSAHNTLVIDGTDQSIYGGSFLWLRDVKTEINHFHDDDDVVSIEASHDGYLRLNDPVTHRRKLSFNRRALELVIEDRFNCARQHRYAAHWQFSPDCVLTGGSNEWVARREVGSLVVRINSPGAKVIIVSGQEAPPLGWVSRHFYERQSASMLVVTGNLDARTVIRTVFSFSYA